MLTQTISAPWTATLSGPEHILVSYFLVVASLALFAGFLRTLFTRGEVGARYRTASVAQLAITGVAFMSYLVLIAQFSTGYDPVGDEWVPNGGAILTLAVRYMDWSVTVPLLSIALLSLTTLTGAKLRRATGLALAGSFLMIFAGFIGSFVVDGGENPAQLVIWGVVSCLFWALTMVVLIRAVRGSMLELTVESGAYLRTATILLLSGWVVYPLLYVVPLFGFGGVWTTVIQVGLSVTDVAVKVGFGTLLQRVAKLRTAEDVRAGDDIHGESIWISSIKRSDAGTPREVFLADGASAHRRRTAPAENIAVASTMENDDL